MRLYHESPNPSEDPPPPGQAVSTASQAHFQDRSVQKIREGVELEIQFGKDCLPNELLGLTHKKIDDYIKYVADRRLEKLGLPKQYETPNPYPWMSEIIDLRKEKNFFETRVTEYQTGGTLEWD